MPTRPPTPHRQRQRCRTCWFFSLRDTSCALLGLQPPPPALQNMLALLSEGQPRGPPSCMTTGALSLSLSLSLSKGLAHDPKNVVAHARFLFENETDLASGAFTTNARNHDGC